MLIGCAVPMEMYEAAGMAGFDYAELPAWQVEALGPGEIHAFVERKKACGLETPRLNAYCRGTPAIVGPYVDDENTRRYAKRLMERASLLGVSSVGIGAPAARRLPEDFDKNTADAQCENFLQITAEVARSYGIRILLESVRSGMCDYMNRFTEAVSMLEKLCLPGLGLVADLYHMKAEGEPFALLETYGKYIEHVHVSTAGKGLCRGLYDDRTEKNCIDDMAAIRGAGYDGSVSIEPDADSLSLAAMTTAALLMRKETEWTRKR